MHNLNILPRPCVRHYILRKHHHKPTETSTSIKMEWKKDNKTYQILQDAEKGGYGVVAAIA